MNCETIAITMATNIFPEARKADTMQSCTPIAPHTRDITRMKRAPSATTSASPDTKKATSAGAKT